MPENIKQENRFILLTLILVLLLGVPTIHSLSLNENSFETSGTTITTEMNSSNRANNVRLPASNDLTSPDESSDQEIPPQIFHLQEELLTIDCEKKELLKSTQSLRLKIQSTPCKHWINPSNLTIINETNGFTATVFAKDQSGFITDLIHLNPGENHILLKTVKSKLRKILITVKPIQDQPSEM